MLVAKALLLVPCLLAVASSHPTSDSNDDLWESFKRDHNKQYDTPEIEATRRAIFFDNKRKIDEHNVLYERGEISFKLGINPLADVTLDEIPNKGIKLPDEPFTLFSVSQGGPIQFEATGAKLPETVDWREKGILSPIKAQYNCLACWAFAATDAIESQYALKYGKHLLLSQQQLVDCSQDEGNLGCQGGMVDWAYKYIMRVGGLEQDSDYPYQIEDDKCTFNASKIAASITNYGEIKNGSEVSLQEAVAFYGPVSVCIDSSSFQWNYYTEGIFDYPYCTTDVDHAVVVVGYGTENGTDYWLVKNSYGETFGQKGFIKMARNKGNQCAIASYGNFPIVGDWKPFSPPTNA
ncbi:hypothetical protein GE061_015443 [Apolygus lucorum]|uniref:Peptidase C1A papain C-terminal domain-containing protein n=1 Tax=Apolygus lucorum TaxID=248454 RepID=A0A6A4J1J0_APOLU|nr:hypothetical protein GE061_015443 [Apolygus lucorum]